VFSVEDFGGFLAGEVFDHVCENVAIIGNDFKVKNLRGSALAVSFAARADGDKWAGRDLPGVALREAWAAQPYLFSGCCRRLTLLGRCGGSMRVHANGCFKPSNHHPGHDRAVM
jgi:hypothetical protein